MPGSTRVSLNTTLKWDSPWRIRIHSGSLPCRPGRSGWPVSLTSRYSPSMIGPCAHRSPHWSPHWALHRVLHWPPRAAVPQPRPDLLAAGEMAGFHGSLDVARQEAAQKISDRWQKQEETRGIGHETRSQQQGAGDQQARAIEQFPGRQCAAVDLFPGPQQRSQALGPELPGTEHRRQHHQGEGPPQADPAADLDEDGDFDEWNADESGQKEDSHACSFPGGSLSILGKAVVLQGLRPEIRFSARGMPWPGRRSSAHRGAGGLPADG